MTFIRLQDHPGTDDAFWEQADAQAAAQPAAVRLDGEVVDFFRRAGEGYELKGHEEIEAASALERQDVTLTTDEVLDESFPARNTA